MVNQTTGTLNASTGIISLGRWDGSYGNYNLSGGSLSVLHVYSGGYGNNNGNSIFNQSGGTANVSGSTTMNYGGSGTNVLHVSAGNFNETAGNLTLNNGGGLGVATVSGGKLTVSSGSIVVSNNSGGSGILNLNGGVTQANAVTFGSGTGIVNFNGGTLQASGSAATAFMTGLTSANIYSGAPTIDSNGQKITIGQALLAASGSGVSSIPITAGGSGYIGPGGQNHGGGGTGQPPRP